MVWDQADRWRNLDVILRSRIVTYAAGREAEEEILGSSGFGDGEDRRQIAFMLDSVGIPEDNPTPTRAFAGRRAGVRRHRREIEALADELLRRESLAGEEVDALLGLRQGEVAVW